MRLSQYLDGLYWENPIRIDSEIPPLKDTSTLGCNISLDFRSHYSHWIMIILFVVISNLLIWFPVVGLFTYSKIMSKVCGCLDWSFNQIAAAMLRGLLEPRVDDFLTDTADESFCSKDILQVLCILGLLLWVSH